MIAREKGLEPLAQRCSTRTRWIRWRSSAFLDPEKGVESVEDALAGARDIIAEWVNEDQKARARMRDLFATQGNLQIKGGSGKRDGGIKYRDYFDWEEPVATAPSHRILAMRRGENEEFLTLRWSLLKRRPSPC